MSVTSFSFPTRTLFGAGSLRDLPAHLTRLGIQRPLVVTDPGLVPTDAFRALVAILGAEGQDRSWFLFGGPSQPRGGRRPPTRPDYPRQGL